MHLQSRLLSAAIVAALAGITPALAAPATAGFGAAKSSASLRARSLAEGPAAATVRRAAADAFVAQDVVLDRNGTEHVRFQRTYRGLPVIGGDFVLHSRNGRAVGVSQSLKTTARPALLPHLTVDRAIVEAGARFGTGFTGVPNARLVVYALGAAPALAYEVTYSGVKADQTPTEMHYFVDARTGHILNQWDRVHTAVPGPDGGSACAGAVTATGTGKTLLSGDVALDTVRCGSGYQLRDPVRGGGYVSNMGMRTIGLGSIMVDTDNVWGTGALSSAQTVAADAHYGVARTWDYFRTMHGRAGIANDGRGVLSRVHYGRNYVNAFWSDGCFCMTFGDGDNGVNYNPLVVLDVVGHEMTHGITSRTADLVYSGESGGLNEATSDIFGTLVEYFADNGRDRPDYLVGEKVYARNPAGTAALRYMFKPSLDGSSPDCYSPALGGLDVHYSSGVANHFFYLLAEGAAVPAGFGAGTPANLTEASLVCNGNTDLAAIGRDAAGAIWYRALTTYMTSNTNYAGAAVATLNAAADLYGAGSTQHEAVVAAWNAVGVNVNVIF